MGNKKLEEKIRDQSRKIHELKTYIKELENKLGTQYQADAIADSKTDRPMPF